MNNRIYIHEDISPGSLSAFDATTGEKKWSYRFSDYSSSTGPVRSGPGTAYSVLTAVPQGTTVTILATEGTWYKVKLADGTTGYIAASLVSVK